MPVDGCREADLVGGGEIERNPARLRVGRERVEHDLLGRGGDQQREGEEKRAHRGELRQC
ncbi:hypothetical protein GCM10011395_29970 [Sphingomonas psychrolutea]|uniref:Uncharacterized protein n=1 Tax=Sphingomonas psychrolutea TaxID=1259676 RepID=A0ABQ1H521_9SPHN|nr:hypothetical protein GCM10011395_29970 [Sphingomonas psychrolutea]